MARLAAYVFRGPEIIWGNITKHGAQDGGFGNRTLYSDSSELDNIALALEAALVQVRGLRSLSQNSDRMTDPPAIG